MMSSWTDVEDGGSWWENVEHMAETTEEELNLFFSYLVLKTSTRRCLVCVLNENLLSAKQLQKPC